MIMMIKPLIKRLHKSSVKILPTTYETRKKLLLYCREEMWERRLKTWFSVDDDDDDVRRCCDEGGDGGGGGE